MKQEFFWPIYKQIEDEFRQLSFYINIDRKQLKTYSIKIADLILRTVAECENISKALCQKKGIKFIDKKGQIRSFVNFAEYIEKLNEIFALERKHVSFIYSNASENTFDSKHQPFRKITIGKNKKNIETWTWYHSYNSIKHDRIKNYENANLENLISGMAALFLLNIYYKNAVFYEKNSYELNVIIGKIESFSEVFCLDYTVITSHEKKYDERYRGTFFNPTTYFKVAIPYSTYIIEYDKEIKTESDHGADLIDKLESSVLIKDTNGNFSKKYEQYELTDHTSNVCVVGHINELENLRMEE